jgi:hypothetical protein
VDDAGNPLSKGAAETWLMDLAGPTVLSNAFDHTGGHQVLFKFSEDVAASLLSDDLELTNLTTRTTYRPGDLSVRYDRADDTASFALRSGPLPNGNYTATLLPAGVTDAAGNTLDGGNTVLEFFVLHGDVNRDRSVNGSDFALLAGSFGKTGQTYAAGDLNGDGAVNGSDFAILAGNFGRTLPPPRPPVVASAAPAPGATQAPAPAPLASSSKAAKKTRPASPRGDVTQPPSRPRRTPRAPAVARRR